LGQGSLGKIEVRMNKIVTEVIVNSKQILKVNTDAKMEEASLEDSEKTAEMTEMEMVEVKGEEALIPMIEEDLDLETVVVIVAVVLTASSNVTVTE
jgi:hypothetical protein